jgi:hypothetical protein|nr:MAG: hypothetical protein DIU57_11690 [Pseudomonadota bacterium]
MIYCSASNEARVNRPLAGVKLWAALLACVMGLALASCSRANSTRLPELATLPEGLLTKEQQQEAVEKLQERRKVHREQAIEEIKSARRN